jgi:hypothetical protein
VNILSRDQQSQIIAALTEGMSIRSIERVTGIHRDTIMRLGARVGAGCQRLHDRTMHSLRVGRIELDEIWSYVGKKQKRVTRNEIAVAGAEHTFEQRAADSSESSLRQDDARQSIEVLHALQRMRNQLAPFDFVEAPQRQGTLRLADVEVSARADMLVHGDSRNGVPQIGSAILRMTQDDTESDSARSRRREMGLYVATIARLQTDQNISSAREPANRLCMSIDVQHGEVFLAPDSNTRRMNDVQNACQFIAAMWDRVS